MASEASAPPTPGNLKRIVGASLVGTTIEWYDFFLYGSAAALVFNKVFFPDSDPLVGTLLSFLTYAVGFAARPLGALVFGHYGDRLGRKKLLVISLLMMGGATFLIGLLPTHATIGTAAPLLLTVLRLVQGFALGGEWGGAVLLVSEHGDAKRRGFWASWPQTGAPAGQLLATAVLAVLTAVLSEQAFISWGGASRSSSPGCWSWSACGFASRSTSRRCSRRRWPAPRRGAPRARPRRCRWSRS